MLRNLNVLYEGIFGCNAYSHVTNDCVLCIPSSFNIIIRKSLGKKIDINIDSMTNLIIVKFTHSIIRQIICRININVPLEKLKCE